MSRTPREPAALACLERTRLAVLNVLVAAGVGIAVSAFFLRGHDRGVLTQGALSRAALFGSLLIPMLANTFFRRVGAGRAALGDPARRGARFHRAHVRAAIAAALAVPIGLAYGLLFDPRPGMIVLFWVVALGMGSLALPRAHELEDFDQPMPDPEPNEPHA